MEPNEERQGNDKKAERLAKRRERRRQRLLEENERLFIFMSDCSSLVASDGTTHYEHFPNCDRMCNDIFFKVVMNS